VVKEAPQELVRFTEDFNQMTQQLARYERELRTSHVAMAHELRSPLTAAMGRLQGILDGVFPAEPQQLAMIMKQLTQLSRLIDELHLLSLADAGQLVLNRERFNLSELLRERTGWLLPQAEQAGVTISVIAPLAGVLQELEVREGMTLAAGAPLARINGLDSVWLEVTVPEAQRAGIQVGQQAAARLPALPGQVIEGEVSAVLPEASAASRTVRVRVQLPNPEGRLRPGLTAQVALAGSETAAVLLVPSEAVIRTGRRALVMLAEAGGRYRPVEVETGRESGSHTAILRGLEEGQQVVASGQFLLDSEASLRGIVAAPVVDAAAHGHVHGAVQPAPALHEAEGRVLSLDGEQLRIAHGPFNTLGMPGMTMRFPVADVALLQGVQPQARIRFAVRETDQGLLIERLQLLEQQP